MTLGHRLGRPKQRRWKGSRIRREIIESIEMGKIPWWLRDKPRSNVTRKKSTPPKPRVLEWSEIEAIYNSQEDISKCWMALHS